MERPHILQQQIHIRPGVHPTPRVLDLRPRGLNSPPILTVRVRHIQVVRRVAFHGGRWPAVAVRQSLLRLHPCVIRHRLVQAVPLPGVLHQPQVAQTVQQRRAIFHSQHRQRRVFVKIGGLRRKGTQHVPTWVVHPLVAGRNRRVQRAFCSDGQVCQARAGPFHPRHHFPHAVRVTSTPFRCQRAAHQGQRQGQAAGQGRQLAGGVGFQGHGVRGQFTQQVQALLYRQLFHVGDGARIPGKGARQRRLPRGEQARAAGRIHLAEHRQRLPGPGVVQHQQHGLATARQRCAHSTGKRVRVGVSGHIHAQRIGPHAQHSIGSAGGLRIGA